MGLLENTIGAMIGRHSGDVSSGPSPSASGASPYGVLATALIGLLAAKAATGGFGDLGGLMGGKTPAGGTQPTPPPGADTSGSAGGGLLGGLGGLFNQFQQSGHGNLVNSWVGTGQNHAATPTQMKQALDPETIRELAQKTGMSEEEVAARLSQELPQVVDKLTPQGRMPTNDEISAWR